MPLRNNNIHKLDLIANNTRGWSYIESHTIETYDWGVINTFPYSSFELHTSSSLQNTYVLTEELTDHLASVTYRSFSA